MRTFLQPWLLTLLISLAHQQTRTDSSPAWTYTSCSENNGYLTSASDHVTKIRAEKKSGSYVSLKINSEDYVPNRYDEDKDEINLSLNQRITQMVVYASISGSSVDVHKISLTFTNPGSTQTLIQEGSQSSLTPHTFNTPTGYEFVGFSACKSQNEEINRLAAYYRPISCTEPSNIDLKFTGPNSRTIFDGQASQTVTLVATDVTVGYCGPFEISIITYSPATTTTNLITIGTEVSANDKKTVVITMADSQDILDEGTYTISVSAKYQNQTPWLSSATKTYKYEGCLATSIQSFDISGFTAYLGSTTQRQASLWYDLLSGSATATPRCGSLSLTPTVSRSSPSGAVDTAVYSYTVVGQNNVLAITPTDVSHVGTWVFTFKYCLPNTFSSVCAEESTTVTIAVNCVINGSSPPSSSVTVFAAISTISAFPAFTATAGCGLITYSVSETSPAGVSALTTLQYGTLNFQVQSTSMTQVGVHTVSLVALSASTSISETKTFTITVINPCLSTSLTWTTGLVNPMSFVLGKVDTNGVNEPQTQQVPTTVTDQVSTNQGTPGLCGGFSYSISDSPASGVASFSTGQLVISASGLITIWTDVALSVGVHTVTVSAKLSQYSSVIAATRSFSLTVTGNCLLTKITIGPTAVQDFVAFAGYETQSQSIYTFNDTASFLYTLPSDPVDFCGEKILTFTVNATQSLSFLSALNQDFIKFSPLTGTTFYGVGQAQLVVNLKDYPLIANAPIRFTATILGSEVPLNQDSVYSVDSPPLTILYDTFKVLPSSYPAPASEIKAYILAEGTTLPDKIDLNCGCLTLINGLSWISHDASTNTFSVSTSDGTLVGDYYIVITQQFDLFPDVIPYSKFKLTIQSAFVAPVQKSPPFFRPSLENQIVQQCADNAKVELWSYTLPDIVDPNGSLVTAKVKLNQTYLAFDSQALAINQINTSSTSFNQTIKITLKNKLNLTSTYSMEVQFICNSSSFTPNFTQKEQLELVSRQKIWPKAIITKIEQNGLMRVRFDRKMKIPDHPEYIQNETITLNETTYPILKLSIIPGNFSDQSMLGFNWTFVKFTPSEMLIQLDFQHLNYVSNKISDPDQIQMIIYGFQLFADVYGNFMSPPTILKPKQLPQLASISEVATVQSAVSSAKGTLQTAMLTNSIVALLIQGPLSQLLSAIKQLQILVHIALINVVYPVSVTMFFSMLMSVLTFQFYDFTDFFNMVLKLDPDAEGNQPLNDQFSLMGYGSHYIVQNFGTLCWTIFVMPLAYATAPLVVLICRKDYKNLKLKANRLMYFDYWLGFLNETYLFLGVCVGLNLKFQSWTTYGEGINTALAYLFGSLILALPFFASLFYTIPVNYNKILKRDQNFLDRYGAIIQGLNFKRQKRQVISYCVAVLIRKFWLVHLIVFQLEVPVFCIFQVNFQALIMMTIIGFTSPMVNKIQNTMDLMNEGFILLVTYHLYQFTDFMTDLQMRKQIGLSMIFVTVFSVFLNIGVVVVQTAVLSQRKLKLKYLAWKQAKEIKKQLEARQHKIEMAALIQNAWTRDEQAQQRIIRAEKEREQLAQFLAQQWHVKKQISKSVPYLDQLSQDQVLSRPRFDSANSVPYLDELLQDQNLTRPRFESQLVFGSISIPRQQTTQVSTAQRTTEEPVKLFSAVRQHEYEDDLTHPYNQTFGQPTLFSAITDMELMVRYSENARAANNKIITNQVNLDGVQAKSILRRPTFQSDSTQVKGLIPESKKTVLSLGSQFQNNRIDVNEIYNNLGIVSEIEVQVEGQTLHRYQIDPSMDPNSVSQLKQQAEYLAHEIDLNADENSLRAFKNGTFEAALSEYAKQRIRWLKYGHSFVGMFSEDLGEYYPSMDLNSKIDLYFRIQKSKSRWSNQKF